MTRTRSGGRPGRALITLGILLALIFGGIFAGVKFAEGQFTPKLALDLEGGTQIVLTPRADTGEEVTSEAINEAISIIRQRVDAAGVAEAEITSQGGRNIVVALAGEPDQATLDLVRESAQMQFRPVLVEAMPEPIDPDEELDPDADLEDELGLDGDDEITGSESEEDGASAGDDAGSAEEADSADDGDAEAQGVDDGAEDADDDAAADDESSGEGAADEESADKDESATPDSDDPADTPEDPSDPAWITDELLDEFYALDCTSPDALIGGGTSDADLPLVTCEQEGNAKYILGPVEVQGSEIKDANAGLGVTSAGVQTNNWVVNLEFKSQGREDFATISSRLVNLEPPRNQFGVVLDDLVIVAPRMNTIINDGRAEITGNFTRESAQTLSSQLRFGALPLSFEVQSEEQISATLGSEQLEKGLIAGVVGLFLVLVFSLYQYRGLGIITFASLAIAGALTYGLLVILGTLQGYRLSLPGVAGVIVAIGITADSFIVYFERVRDEVREGRSLVAAVDRGWDRAKRTILVSDAVSFVAAIVLYFLAVGGVRGFAFTLGLTTLIDVIVVFLFTHPMLTLLVRTKFFGGGHKYSGLDPVHLGQTVALARGRGAQAARAQRSKKAAQVQAGVLAGSGGGPAGGGRLTIAERRAAEAAQRAAQEAEAGEPGGSDTRAGESGASGTGAAETGAAEAGAAETGADERSRGTGSEGEES